MFYTVIAKMILAHFNGVTLC